MLKAAPSVAFALLSEFARCIYTRQMPGLKNTSMV